MKENKKAILSLIIGIILGGLIFSGVTYYLVSSGEKTEDKEQNNNEDTENNDQNNDEEENEIDEEKGEIKPLDLTKCLNPSGYTYTFENSGSDKPNPYMTLEIEDNKKNAVLNIDIEKLSAVSDVSSSDSNVYPIVGFSKEIKEAFIGVYGQSIQSTILFYLMEDGTVEYTRVFNSKGKINYTYNYTADGKENSQRLLKTAGAVTGVKDVVKLYNVSALAGISGHVTTIGATKDGSFYDLGKIIGR